MTLRSRIAACAFTLWTAAPLWAAEPFDDVIAELQGADIVLLGEVHDNPTHHDVQAEAVARIAPSAIVWEMLTGVQAARIDAALIAQPDAMAEMLDWADSGWPDFDLYYPIFTAAPGARMYGGGVPREAARAAMDGGAAVAFGAADAARYGLTVSLPARELIERRAFQMAAHCDAIPEEMTGLMIDVQRLRDAELARAAIRAHDETGGPVVVITGNGHARTDWGIPVYLARVAPGLRVFSVGQSEDGQIAGTFDAVLDAPAVWRRDPCLAFRPTQPAPPASD
jgi:uncharacterized iron-regulated protein